MGRAEYASPASFAQERLWFLTQLEPDTPRYHVCLTARLGRRTDVRRLGRALVMVCARHEVLRTALSLRGDSLVQVVVDEATARLGIADLSGVRPAGTRHREFRRIARDDATTPFALATAPLVRVRLVRMSPSDHRLILVAHRAIADPASIRNLLSELIECDAALAARRQAILPALVTQYGDFAVSQRALLGSGVLDAQLEYWLTRLADLPPDPGLPTDRPRPRYHGTCETAGTAGTGEAAGGGRVAGGRVEVDLPDGVVAQLAALVRARGTTLFAALLAGFKAVLQRFSGRSDIVVGWPSSGRVRPELVPLIGAFENPLVLRTDLAGDPTFERLIDRVHDTVEGGLGRADVPFERLVDAVPADRDPSRHPLFQVSFTAPYARPASDTSLPTPTPPYEMLHNGAARLDLEVEVQLPVTGPPTITMAYSTELFDPPTVQRIAAAYRTLLIAAAARPESPLSELPVLAATDVELIDRWNHTGREHPDDTVHDWILAQARSLPDAPAICHEGSWWSYRQVAARADDTASELRRGGLRPGEVVGVFLPGRPELAPTILGVLAAGGAYAQLEPDLGAARLRRLLTIAGIRLVLTTRSLATRLGDLPGVMVRCVAPEAPTRHDAPRDLGSLGVSPDAIACVVLADPPVPGEPAPCVGLSHRAIVNRLHWMQEALALGPRDRVLNRARYCFDASVWELFLPLSAGAGVVIASEEQRNDVGRLADLVDRERVTVAGFPANLLEPFLELPELLGLARVICFGPPPRQQLVARCFERLPGVRLYHCCGPVETAGSVAWRAYAPGRRATPAVRPVANTRFEVLDGSLRRVPVGAVGELCVGGEQLAGGYLGQPRLTAARFIADPYRRQATLFRTGSLARWLPDGQIEPVAHELTPRGHFDATHLLTELERHTNVHRAEVTVRPDALGNRRLVAHVQWTGGPDSLADVLRRYLLSRLPRALVPAAFVATSRFPMLPDGGLDRAALPSPSARLLGGRQRRRYIAPRTPAERTICGLWSDLLGRNDVGVECDFFDLGGHSLLAARMISIIGQTFGVEIALRRCFELSTVAEYALAVLDLQLQQTGYDIDGLDNALQTWEATP